MAGVMGWPLAVGSWPSTTKLSIDANNIGDSCCSVMVGLASQRSTRAPLFGVILQAPLVQQGCGPHARPRARSRSLPHTIVNAIVIRNATRDRGRITENRTACH